MPADQKATPKPKLRWFQYSLRSLLIFATLFAVACSWFTVKMQQAKKQKECVEAITKAGGEVVYEYENTPNRPQPTRPPQPIWLRNLLGDDFFNRIAGVNVATDAEMVSLKEFPKLQFLIAGTKITDGGMENVRGLSELQILSIAGTEVTDNGVKCLEGLTKLTKISLMNTKITNVALEHLKDMTQLQ